jgi:hypothetical protein
VTLRATRLAPSLAAFVLAGSIGTACSSPAVAPGFTARFEITTDEPAPLAGASLSVGSQTVGITDSNGVLSVEVPGKQGDVLPVKLSCPGRFVDPGPVPALRLVSARKLGDAGGASMPVVWTGICTRAERQVALVVHSESRAGLPVLVEGTRSGVTDAGGNLHVLLTRPTSAMPLHVVLDTSGAPALRPQNPSRVFDLGKSDEIVVFDEKFVAAAPPVARRPQRKGPSIPYRID